MKEHQLRIGDEAEKKAKELGKLFKIKTRAKLVEFLIDREYKKQFS